MKFSLLQLCGWTAVVGGCLGVVFGLPSVVSVGLFGLTALVLPVTMVSGIVYARRALRAFFVGATVASLPVMLMTAFYLPMLLIDGGIVQELMTLNLTNLKELDQDGSMTLIKYNCAGYLAFVALNGAVAVAVRWLVSPREPLAAAAVAHATATGVGRSGELSALSIAPPAPHFERSAAAALEGTI